MKINSFLPVALSAAAFGGGALVTAAALGVVAVPPFGGCVAAAVPAAQKGAPAPVRWTQMPILPPEAAKAGVTPGGEGGQWPRDGVAIAASDPDFLLLPIDVGGLYRSLDGGKRWEIAVVGWNARGANALAIDPKNADRVIGVAGNSLDWNADWGASPNGVYLSTDRAGSWKHVLALLDGDRQNAAAFDPSSFDARKGHCTVAYVSSNRAGLLKTTDGGETWKPVSDLPVGSNHDKGTPGHLAVHPKTGAVYFGGKNGLHVSSDGGKSFTRLHDAAVYGLAVHADRIWVSGAAGLLTSADGGKTFTVLPASGADRTVKNKPLRDVRVSPADPKRMTVWVEGDNWQWARYVSHDGGASFSRIDIQRGLAPLPQNVRQGWYSWHPTDPDVVYGLGGDWVTKSADGGKSFTWFNNGNNGIMLGGLFSFSAHAPDSVFLAFQDYNAAFTTDGGKTWNYRDASGKGWGGMCYAGHTPDGKVMFYGDSEHWGPPLRLRISHDGGGTWSFVNGPDGKPLSWGGNADSSLSDPGDPKVLFAGPYRSADGGGTWAKMAACDVVHTYRPGTKALYGRKGDAVVTSTDHGATWEKVADVEGGFGDLAVDHKTGRVYVASQDRLKAWVEGKWTTLETPADQYGNVRVTTVAVDPQDPRVVYVGGPRNTYASHATVCRSTDSGVMWTNLTVNAPLGKGGPGSGGPHEVSAIRVHPKTREAWVAGQCYGMWRIAPPAAGETGKPAALASAPRALRPPSVTSPFPAVASGRP